VFVMLSTILNGHKHTFLLKIGPGPLDQNCNFVRLKCFDMLQMLKNALQTFSIFRDVDEG